MCELSTLDDFCSCPNFQSNTLNASCPISSGGVDVLCGVLLPVTLSIAFEKLFIHQTKMLLSRTRASITLRAAFAGPECAL